MLVVYPGTRHDSSCSSQIIFKQNSIDTHWILCICFLCYMYTINMTRPCLILCIGIVFCNFTAITSHWPNVVLMLAHYLWCWTNIMPTLGQCLVFAGYSNPLIKQQYTIYDMFFRSIEYILAFRELWYLFSIPLGRLHTWNLPLWTQCTDILVFLWLHIYRSTAISVWNQPFRSDIITNIV